MGDFYKGLKQNIVIMDSEYVPCLETGSRLYGLGDAAEEKDILDAIYNNNGRTEEDQQPMIRFLLYKIICLSYIVRRTTFRTGGPNSVSLELHSLPINAGTMMSEKDIIEQFLSRVGTILPQIVGYGSKQFDMNVLTQRALINKCRIPGFFKRPDSPWNGADYHAKFGSDYQIDLCDVICGFGSKTRCTLDEIAKACGIPGKLGVEGKDVCNMFYDGKLQEIINYCECDTATTYLLWLETAAMSMHISEQEYEIEKYQFHGLLTSKIKSGSKHFERFLQEWDFDAS